MAWAPSLAFLEVNRAICRRDSERHRDTGSRMSNSSSLGRDLAGQIRELQVDRQRHAEAIAAIDRVLTQIEQALADATPEGIPSPSPVRPPLAGLNARGAEPAKAYAPWSVRAALPAGGGAAAGTRRRGRFAQTAEQSVAEFIRQRGNPSTADINAFWRAQGRKGTANVTLLKLLKSGVIRRQPDPTVRGSRYVSEQQPGGNGVPGVKSRAG